MDTKLFKAFTAYRNLAGVTLTPSEFSTFEDWIVEDPSPTSWSSIGFAYVQGEELFIDVQGGGYIALVQYNERILPAAVQKEKIALRVADIEGRDGRKIGKKQYAQVRDDVILELLPGAFIKRKLIPVMFRQDRMFLFSSSAKMCDDVMLLLQRSFANANRFNMSSLANCVTGNIGGAITTLAKEGEVDQYGDKFIVNNSAVLKGPAKQTIRIKDKDIQSDDVSRLLKQEYDVTQIGVDFYESGEDEPAASLVLNDKLVFTRFVIAGVKGVRGQDEKDVADTFIATAWMTIRLADVIASLTTKVMGGLKSDAAEDDDDL